MTSNESGPSAGDDSASLCNVSSSQISGEIYYPSLAERVFLLYNDTTGNADFDIVLVHGLGSDEFKCWTNEQGLLWPAAFLPQEFPHSRILSVGYTHALWRWTSSEKIKDKGVEETVLEEREWMTSSIRRWLAEAVQGAYSSLGASTHDSKQKEENEEPEDSLVTETTLSPTVLSSMEAEQQTLENCASDLAKRLLSDAVGVGRRPLVFITHSLGGLVVKQMIIFMAKTVSLDLAERERKIGEEENKDQKCVLPEELFLCSLRGIVFYATPHFGAPIPSVVTGLRRYYQTLGGVSPSHVLTSLGDHNREKLSRLNEQFLHIIERCSDIDCVRVLSFGETRRLNGLFRIVEPGSANPAPDNPRFPFYLIDADHIGINCPVSKDQTSYTILFGFLKRMERSGLLRPQRENNINESSHESSVEQKRESEDGEATPPPPPTTTTITTMGNELFPNTISSSDGSGNDEALELCMLLASLDHWMKRLREHSKTLFGCVMPAQLKKVAMLATDLNDYYAITSLSPKEEESVTCLLLIPLHLILYWTKRSVNTLESFSVYQAERSVLHLCSALETPVLCDIGSAVETLQREWESFHLHLCQSQTNPSKCSVVIFFSESVTLAVSDASMDDFGYLLTLSTRCVPDACGWKRDGPIPWGSLGNTKWVPPSVSMVASLLNGWMYLAVLKRYKDGLTAFRRLIRDVEALQQGKYNLSCITDLSTNVQPSTQDNILNWWRSGDGGGNKAKGTSLEGRDNLLNVFALLAHAGVCWSHFLLTRQVGMETFFSSPNADAFEGETFHNSLMEGRRRFKLLDRIVNIDNIMDSPFAYKRHYPDTSTHVKIKSPQTTLEEEPKRSPARTATLLKGAALRRSMTFFWDDVRQGEGREEAANRFTASVLVFWWIIERRVELQKSLGLMNGLVEGTKTTEKGFAFHDKSPWVWENAHPRVKSQWLTWWCITSDTFKKPDEMNKEQLHILSEALQLYNYNALALYLTGRQHLWRGNLREAAEAYLQLLQFTRCVGNALYRVASVGLGWVHLHHYHCGVLEGSGVDPLAFQGASSRLKECWWLSQWKKTMTHHESWRGKTSDFNFCIDVNDNNNEIDIDPGCHLERASVLFETVISFDPCDKGALCGMGRVKLLKTEAALNVDFSCACRYFVGVVREVKAIPGKWETDIMAIDNGKWESRAAYWLGEIHKCSLDVNVNETGEGEENGKKRLKAFWEYAVRGCPQNDCALTSLGFLYSEKNYNNNHHHYGGDAKTLGQREIAVEYLQRSLAINTKNTWSLWGLLHLVSDETQRNTYRMLLKKLLRR